MFTRKSSCVERAEIQALVAEGADAVSVVIARLEARIDEQDAQIAELKARLGQSSRNSSKPPSSDGYGKPPPKKRSLRRPSGRERGGQEGHAGARLEPVAVPDERVEHRPERCDGCGGSLAGAERLGGGESRQVLDLPEGKLLPAIEHVAERRRCGCGRTTAAGFPDGVGAPTQYGPGVRALGVYLCVYQHLPYDRAARALADLAGARVSTGTLQGWVEAAAAGLSGFDERLRELLVSAPVVHFDETGARIAERLGWVHSQSTEKLTRYVAHRRRGGEAIDDAGVLPDLRGVAVHDGWSPYRNYEDALHALCNGHRLRELIAAAEAGHRWPEAMGELLLDAKEQVDERPEGRRAEPRPEGAREARGAIRGDHRLRSLIGSVRAPADTRRDEQEGQALPPGEASIAARPRSRPPGARAAPAARPDRRRRARPPPDSDRRGDLRSLPAAADDRLRQGARRAHGRRAHPHQQPGHAPLPARHRGHRRRPRRGERHRLRAPPRRPLQER